MTNLSPATQGLRYPFLCRPSEKADFAIPAKKFLARKQLLGEHKHLWKFATRRPDHVAQFVWKTKTLLGEVEGAERKLRSERPENRQ